MEGEDSQGSVFSGSRVNSSEAGSSPRCSSWAGLGVSPASGPKGFS